LHGCTCGQSKKVLERTNFSRRKRDCRGERESVSDGIERREEGDIGIGEGGEERGGGGDGKGK